MKKNKALFPDTGNSWLRNQKLILTILTIGGIVVVSLWQLLDRFYLETAVPVLFWLRLGTIGFFACNLLIAHLPKQKENTKLHIIIGFYAGTLFCSLMVALTGASQSPYWYSLFFIIIAWFVLIPYHFREMTLHSIVFIAIFVFGQFIQSSFPVVLYEMVRMVFLYSVTLLVGVFASNIRNRLDSENEYNRKKLKENNDELLALNEELRAEIENHQHTTNQLIEKQNFLDNILNNAPIVIWSIDLDGKFTYSQYTGDKALQSSKRIGKSALELHKGTAVEDFLNRLLKGETQSEVLAVGDNFYDTRVTPVLNANRQKIGYMGVSMDITERIKIERELAKFKLVLDQAPGAVFIVDKQSNFEYINPEFTKISGYTKEDLLGKSLNQTLYKGSVPESRKEIIETIAAGNKWQGELLTINKNGTNYWANTIAAPYKTEQGRIEGFIVIQQDISRRKEMELALQEKEKLYRTLIEKSMDGVAISQDGEILLANKAFCDILGYQIDELLSTEPEKLLAPEDKEMVLEKHYKRLSGERSPSRYQARFLHKSGKKVILDLNAATVLMNGKNASFVTIRDITDQQTYEQALKESEEKYKALVENSQDSIIIVRDNKMLFVNDAFCKLIGQDCETIYSTPATQFIHPDDRHYLMEIGEKRKSGDDSTINFSIRLNSKTGNVFECETFSSTIFYQGMPASFFTLHNVTESKRMQQALRESEEKYRTLVETSQDGICLTQEGKFKFVNRAMCEMLGYTAQELYSLPGEVVIPENMREKVLAMNRDRMEGKKVRNNYNMELIAKDGSMVEVEIQASTSEFEGRPAGFYTVHNITHSRKIQAALRESEKKYRELTEMLPQTVYELDIDGKILYMNQTGFMQFAMDNSDIGTSAYRFIDPLQHEQMRQNIIKTVTEKQFSYGNRYTAVRKDGSKFPALTYAAPMVSEDTVVGVRGIIIDISDYEAMERALRESEEKYRTLIEKATDGVIITQNGKLKFVNEAMARMSKYSVEELVEKPFLEMVPVEDHQVMIDYHKRRMAGEDFVSLYRSHVIRKDGEIITVELNSRTSLYNGNPAAFIIVRDISDRLNTEKELQSAKNELEKLNQELETRILESSLKLTEANTQLIRLQKENLQSQFEVLRQQVNPHFLFNSLNVLTSLIKLEPDLAEKFTEHLSKVYRYVLENKDNDLVPIQTELDFLDAYIFLLNIRFTDKILVEVNIGEEKKNMQILPLALQLLIENAIKHNAMSRKNPLKIDIFMDHQNWLNVVNNLQERESHMSSTGVGLKNIEHRYKLLDLPAPEFYKTEKEFVAKIPLRF